MRAGLGAGRVIIAGGRGAPIGQALHLDGASVARAVEGYLARGASHLGDGSAADPPCRGPLSPGMLRALLGRQLFRARGPPAVREPFPRAARFPVRYVWPPGDRPLRVGPGPPLPPGPLHLHLLPAPTHQGLLPGARWEALLPALLPQTLRLTACGARPSGRPRPQRPSPYPQRHALHT